MLILSQNKQIDNVDVPANMEYGLQVYYFLKPHVESPFDNSLSFFLFIWFFLLWHASISTERLPVKVLHVFIVELPDFRN